MSYANTPSEDHMRRMRENYRYNEVNGGLVSMKTGQPLTKRAQRYAQLRIDNTSYVVHRVVWYLCNGSWPTMEIDHKDGDTFNNRISNLRLAGMTHNAQNRRAAHKNNKLGVMGVHLHKPGVYRAVIMVNGENRNLGLYKSAEAAHFAYLEAKRENHEFNTL